MRRRVLKDPLPSDHGHHGVGHTNRRPPPRNSDRLVRCPRPKQDHRRSGLMKFKGKVLWLLAQAEMMLPAGFGDLVTHFLMILAIGLVVSAIFTHKKYMSNKVDISPGVVKSTTLNSFCYLATFGLHMGSQYWMTLVSGFSLYFNLSKHAFGDVQKILFPKYFLSNSFLSACVLMQFSKLNEHISTWDYYTSLQMYVLSMRLLVEAFIRLYLVPPLLGLMSAKIGIESAAGIGKRVGRNEIGSLVDCPHYMEISRSFRKVHTLMALGNVFSIVCTAIHLLYMAAFSVYGADDVLDMDVHVIDIINNTITAE